MRTVHGYRTDPQNHAKTEEAQTLENNHPDPLILDAVASLLVIPRVLRIFAAPLAEDSDSSEQCEKNRSHKEPIPQLMVVCHSKASSEVVEQVDVDAPILPEAQYVCRPHSSDALLALVGQSPCGIRSRQVDNDHAVQGVDDCLPRDVCQHGH